MKIRALLLSSMLLVTIPLLARKTTDVIVLMNGDRITCEIKRLNGGILFVDSDYIDGTMSVDWSKVVRLESSQLFVLLTQDGSTYEGTLTTAPMPAGRSLKIQVRQTSGKRAEIERSQIVRMTQTSQNFRQRLSGALNLGLNYSKGNNATQYTLGTEAQYIKERWGAQANFSSNLSSNTGSATSTRNQLGLSGYHLLPWQNYFYGGVGNFLQSSVLGIRLQTTLGVGIGRFLRNTDRTSIAVLGGSAWQSTDYKGSVLPQNTQNLATALIAAEITLFRFKKTRLGATAMLFPAVSDPGRIRFLTNTTYYLKLFSNLSWNLSFYGNWDNRPQTGFSGGDYGTSLGLSWTFGNR